MREFLLLGLLAAGCQDLRDYQGQWVGGPAADPELQHGFLCDPTLLPQARLAIDAIDHVELRGQLAIMSLLPPGLIIFPNTKLESIKRASGDALGQTRVGHDALRSYVALPLERYLTVVSLFPDDRIELRMISGTDENYCLFGLHRQ